MRQHVEPSAVGHADDDFVGAGLGRTLDRVVEHRDQDVQPFDRESLLTQIGLMQELLQRLHLGKPLQQCPPLLRARWREVGA